MASYSFSTVNDVLPLGVQRAYVPRASRPHLAWAARCTPGESPSLGSHSRLKGDGTAARESLTAQAERERDEAGESRGSGTGPSSTAAPRAAREVALRGLLTTDGATGTRFTVYHDTAAPAVPACSSAVPSSRRIVALWSPPSALEDGLTHLWDGSVPLYVSDEVGNVFHYAWGSAGGSSVDTEPSAKRPRQEASTASACGAATGVWTPLASAHTAIPSTLAAAAAPSSPAARSMESLFAVTRGAPGWAGLSALSSDGSGSAVSSLVSVREFYNDVRVVDPVQPAVVRVYSTTHSPTGMLCPSVQAAPHCVLVAEGCLATLFDVRCPAAVLSLGQVYAAQAEWAAARDAAAAEKAQRELSGATADEAKPATAKSTATESAPLPPLVPGRLTSTVGVVRDVCGTVNPFEVACAVDRALCVYDLRKFNLLFTSSSVLKYVVGNVTPVAGGRAVVCAGIDSEVRLVPLYDKTESAAGEALSLAAKAVAQSQQKKQKQQQQPRSDTPKQADGTGAAASFDVETMGPGGTFRTRLNTSVSCTSVWQGGWVTTQDDDGVAAIGVSIDGEVFLAQ